MSATAAASPSLQPTLSGFDSYVIGLPLVFSVSVQNHSATSTFLKLPDWSLLSASAPLTFVFTDDHHHLTEVASSAKDPANGYGLGPGDVHTELYDLSLLHPSLAPGHYRVKVVFTARGTRYTSTEVEVRLVAPDAADATAIATLLAPVPDRDWRQFLTNHPLAVAAPNLTPPSARQVALHLFIHRALYGQVGLGSLDLRQLATSTGPLEGEAAVYRYELLRARHDPGADAAAADVRRRWPGLGHRLTEIDRGFGMLTGLRRLYGADKPGAKPNPSY